MSSAAKLNQTSSSGYIKFDDLEKGAKYKINDLLTYKSTNFGKDRLCIKAMIDDGYVILPERFDSAVEVLKELDIEKLYMIFNGREKSKKGRQGRILIDFVEESDDEEEKTSRKKSKKQPSKVLKKKTQPLVESEDESEDEEGDDEEEEEEEPPKKKKRSSGVSKRMKKPRVVESEDESVEEEPPKMKSTRSASTKKSANSKK